MNKIGDKIHYVRLTPTFLTQFGNNTAEIAKHVDGSLIKEGTVQEISEKEVRVMQDDGESVTVPYADGVMFHEEDDGTERNYIIYAFAFDKDELEHSLSVLREILTTVSGI